MKSLLRALLPAFFASLIAVSLCPNVFGQEPKSESPSPLGLFTLDDECGNPAVESQLYVYREGLITKVLSSTELLFRSSIRDGNSVSKSFRVGLVGVSPIRNSSTVKAFLSKYVLNRRVVVIGNLRGGKGKRYGAIVEIRENDEIANLNEHLLENGIGIYLNFSSDNLVPYYWPCRLEKAQDRAKAAKAGIWANQ